MFPVFFSVSSLDVEFAEQIWNRLPSDMAYLYSKNGAEGADMWKEISEEELSQSKLIVIFWSKNYLQSRGCVRELSQASDLVRTDRLKAVILRLDDFPISFSADMDPALERNYEYLYPFLKYRSSSIGASTNQCADLIVRVSDEFLSSDHPRWPRHEISKTFMSSLKKDRFNFYPAAWISGFNGSGRETLIKDINRGLVPNGKGIVVEVNESSLPLQIVLKIESELFNATPEKLQNIGNYTGDDIVFLARSIEKCLTPEIM